MKKIVLLCAAGMSTSILVKKMQEAAKADSFDCEIAAYPTSEAKDKAADADVILLGPQVRFQAKKIAEQCPARSSYIEAIRAAKSGDFDGAKKLIKEGDEMFVEGHNAHAGLLEKEANNEVGPLGLLMVHAEDQLMSAEAFKTIALEFIDSYERIEALEAKVKELEK